MLKRVGNADREHDKRRHPEEGPDENQPRAPPLGCVREVAGGEVEGAEAQHHIADHHPPVGHRRTADQSQRVPRVPSPEHGPQVDHRRQQVERQHLGADAVDPTQEVGDWIPPPLPDRSRKDQKEVEKRGRKKEQRDRAGREDEGVHPRVGRRSQATDQKEHEEDGHGEEDPRRRHAGLAQNDKDANTEEEEPEQRGVEIAGVADAPPAELDIDLEDAAAGSHQIRHRFPDVVVDSGAPERGSPSREYSGRFRQSRHRGGCRRGRRRNPARPPARPALPEHPPPE